MKNSIDESFSYRLSLSFGGVVVEAGGSREGRTANIRQNSIEGFVLRSEVVEA